MSTDTNALNNIFLQETRNGFTEMKNDIKSISNGFTNLLELIKIIDSKLNNNYSPEQIMKLENDIKAVQYESILALQTVLSNNNQIKDIINDTIHKKTSIIVDKDFLCNQWSERVRQFSNELIEDVD